MQYILYPLSTHIKFSKSINPNPLTTLFPMISFVIIICFLVGLVASYAFFLVKYLLDDTYKSKNEFEDVTGLKIIAVIPDTKNTKNAAQGNITEAKMRG